jgi:hypothetical protein
MEELRKSGHGLTLGDDEDFLAGVGRDRTIQGIADTRRPIRPSTGIVSGGGILTITEVDRFRGKNPEHLCLWCP